MKELIPEETGEETERRFFAACAEHTAETPSWLRRVKKAKAGLDARGIDAIAQIYHENSHSSSKVPIQIKSSVYGRNLFYRDHPEAWQAGMPVIVVERHDSPEKIRANLYAHLREIRTKNIHFGEFIGRLMEGQLTMRGIQIKKYLRK